MKPARLALLAILFVAARSNAGEPDATDAADKGTYNLGNAVPESLMRDLDPDRPDKTNSPHTVDAGHIQIETGLVSYTRHSDAGVRTESWTVLDTEVRIGLVDWAELQLELPLYESSRDTERATNDTEHSRGIGDLTLVVKTNLWGNDTGDTAGGLAFTVKTPTAGDGLGNGEVEGGATLLLDFALPGDFDLGLNTGAGIAADDDGGHHANIVDSVSLSRAIIGPLSGYVEFFSSVPIDGGADWEGTVDVGSMLKIGANLQLDGGLNIGISHAADDLEPFLGASYRF
jgi:outer membrane putative beta-barrel porin/alpha-amylase